MFPTSDKVRQPDWHHCPEWVGSAYTTRGLVPEQLSLHNPKADFNLAKHVGDDAEKVEQRRQSLQHILDCPTPLWLNQTHSTHVASQDTYCTDAEFDACVVRDTSNAAVVMTADCMPVLFAHKQHKVVAAAHAGWRGLQQGVLLKTLQTMGSDNKNVAVWLGPTISQPHFEVGEEVLAAFETWPQDISAAVKDSRPGHYLLDLYALARIQLGAHGVECIEGGGFCTFEQNELFYSHRRDANSGRQACLLWIKS